MKLQCARVEGNLPQYWKTQEKYACIVEADESMRIRMEELHTDIMKTTLQEKA